MASRIACGSAPPRRQACAWVRSRHQCTTKRSVAEPRSELSANATERPADATATSLVVTGLTNGAGYQFQVAATNAVGTGPNSGLSMVVVPATVPGAPMIGTASGTVGGTVTATANWNSPTSNSGSAVTAYVVRALRMSASGTLLATTTSAVQPASARQLTMTLPTGNYRFTVQANKAGTRPQSARSGLVTAQ